MVDSSGSVGDAFGPHPSRKVDQISPTRTTALEVDESATSSVAPVELDKFIRSTPVEDIRPTMVELDKFHANPDLKAGLFEKELREHGARVTWSNVDEM